MVVTSSTTVMRFPFGHIIYRSVSHMYTYTQLFKSRVTLQKEEETTYPRIPKSIGNVSSVPLYNANSSAENNLFSIWKQTTKRKKIKIGFKT